jgi:peptidoglycan-associated lipoprotein
MKPRALLLALAFAITVAGCSSMGGNKAPIESGDKGSQPTAAQKAAADKAAAEKLAAEKAAAEKVAAEKAAAEKAAAEKRVEVKPVNLEAATGKPLDSADKGGKEGADAMTPDSLKDPNSPLAKRIIYFEYDSSVIKDEFQPVVEVHAQYLKKFKDTKVILQGHTDERGSREYNIALGQRRADAVRKALELLGVPDGQMEAVSFGEEKPAVQGEGEEAWAKNRRSEIHYQGE